MNLEIRSPKHEQASVQIPTEVANLQRPFNGTIASRKGDEYQIENNIIDLLPEGIRNISLAQMTNEWGLTASVYEDLWRNRSLSIFTGEEFPIPKELELMNEWLAPKPDGWYLDVGCSTALYARSLKESEPKANAIALDFSRKMLEQARVRAEDEGRDLYLMRSDARYQPFYGNTFDGMVCGGTLNELSDPQKVLYECRRVLKQEGRFFMMHLIKADHWYGRFLQGATELGGITFWSVKESNQLFDKAGFEVTKQITRGIVCFSLLTPA